MFDVELPLSSMMRWPWPAALLLWTTTPPTAPGWYWAADAGRTPIIVIVAESAKGLRAFFISDDESFDLDYWSHWLGPLPEPEMPKE